MSDPPTQNDVQDAIHTWRMVWISYANDEAKRQHRAALPKYTRLSNRTSETDQMIAYAKVFDADDLFLFSARAWAWMDKMYSRRFDSESAWRAFRRELMAALLRQKVPETAGVPIDEEGKP